MSQKDKFEFAVMVHLLILLAVLIVFGVIHGLAIYGAFHLLLQTIGVWRMVITGSYWEK